MIQLSDNVIQYFPGEGPGPEAAGFIKIALVGSDSYEPSGAYDWQGKFAQGLASICDPNSGNGLIMYKNMKFAVLTCKPANPPVNPVLELNNPDAVNKISATIDFCEQADGIFCNFLKKSEATFPIFAFGYLANSGKMVVRCPEEYKNYPLVNMICQRKGIPLYPGRLTNVLTILQGLLTLPNISKYQQYSLPE